MDRRVDITDTITASQAPIQFSYSVEWYDDFKTTYENRFSRYVDNRKFPSFADVHRWNSIIFPLLVIFLICAIGSKAVVVVKGSIQSNCSSNTTPETSVPLISENIRDDGHCGNDQNIVSF